MRDYFVHMTIPGIDVLLSRSRSPLRRLRIGLIVNPSSVTHNVQHAIPALLKKNFKIACILAPEHGLWASKQDQIKEGHTVDPATGLKIYSLYQFNKKPTATMLRDIDAVVYDVQDIGTRYYTFIWTMALAMEACSRAGKKCIILDRPNPLGGEIMEGPVLDPAYRSFVGLYPLPVRHGMTVGEIALWLAANHIPNVDLDIIKMKGWQRSMWFEDTGLSWVLPSPNMPTVDTAVVYPGMCLFEGTRLSEGRGITRPFELFGAPWIDPELLVREMRKEKLAGCILRPTYFQPTFHKFAGKRCGGCQIHVTSRHEFRSFKTALALLRTIWRLYPKQAKWRRPPYEDEARLMPFDILAGNGYIRTLIQDGVTVRSLENRWQKHLNQFQQEREPFLLY